MAKPHSGQFFALTAPRKLYPHRRHGLSRAALSETNMVPAMLCFISSLNRLANFER
jgi:hypothetical protein